MWNNFGEVVCRFAKLLNKGLVERHAFHRDQSEISSLSRSGFSCSRCLSIGHHIIHLSHLQIHRSGNASWRAGGDCS